MKKYIFFAFLLAINTITQAKIGLNKKFQIIDQVKYEKKAPNLLVLNRYVVVSHFDKKTKDISNACSDEALIAKFAFMLKRNRLKEMTAYISQCDTNRNFNNLLKGLYFFSQYKYSMAMEYLSLYNGNEYKFLKTLLLADCDFELNRSSAQQSELVKKYQRAMDVTSSEQDRNMVNNRIKYLKYNM